MAKDQEIQWLLKEKYQGVMSKEAQIDMTRINLGEPVAYVIGFVEFLGCKIDLSQRPLIPRPETEFWVEQAITMIYHSDLKEIRCLDMFTGSGCVGVAILKNIPLVSVDLVDVDEKAIKQAEINCRLNDLSPSRYNIIKSDIFENIESSYDHILANPPYVAENSKGSVQKSVLDYEPHSALFGGTNGLDYIRKFLEQAPKHLNSGGKIYMEFDPQEKDEIEKILKTKGFEEINFYQDQFGKWRYLVLKKP